MEESMGPLDHGAIKAIGALQGPAPKLFQVWIHHLPAPEANTVAGVIEQVPVPAEHPTCAAVYQVVIFVPVESFTHK